MSELIEIESRRSRGKKPKGPAYTPKKPYTRPEPKKLQPRWKWSYNGNTDKLLVWPTDKWGDPHHIEVTGTNYYHYCQGRIYVYGEGPRESIGDDEEVEIMLWKERGPEAWQAPAIEKVKEWVEENFHQQVDKVIKRSEYAYYQGPVTHSDLNDYYDRLKDGSEDYLAEQYAQAVDRDHEDPEDAYHQTVQHPIDWDTVETNPVSKLKTYVWMWDGVDFHARASDTHTPTAEEFVDKFGDDGTWSSQGTIVVRNNKGVTMIIDSHKPYAFANSEADLKKEQNGALDGGLTWIKTILGLNIENVKYSNEPVVVQFT